MKKNDGIYEVITKRVVKQLENAIKNGERFHWTKDWKGIVTGNAISFLSKNFTPYRGINKLFLDGLYITYKQFQEFQLKHPEIQFKIKKGCHQETVYFYKIIESKTEDDNGEEKTVAFPMMRFYKVFSINDIENLPQFFKVEEKEHSLTDAMAEAESIIADYCKRDGLRLDIVEGSDRCFYRPSEHKVNVPKIGQFKTAEGYYAALFHELVHSTSKTLGRELGGFFGSEKYSKEELIAELGSAFLCSTFGIASDFDNSVAYLQGWLKAIKDSDPSLIVKAATAAQKACDLILGVTYAEKEEQTA